MRPYRLRVPDQLRVLLDGLHPELKRKVRAVLDAVCDEPTVGKALRDELAGLRSARTGPFRIVHRVATGRLVEVVAAGPRRTIYEETLRLLRQGDDERNR